jgi:uncharacterized small protein (DUF1192 family)
MALLTSEVARIRAELGVNLMGVGAVPNFEVYSVFEQVVKPYVLSGTSTTSSTSVSSASSATPVTLTLAATDDDVVAGATVAIDVDARQEIATIQSVSGSDIVVLLTKEHSGTYPVTVESGETIIRELLRQLRVVATEQSSAGLQGGIKKVDEIEFFGHGEGNRLATLQGERSRLRDELSAAIGFPNLHRRSRGGGSSIALY